MQRYFVKEIKENKTYLSEEDSYHLKVVMRKEKGDKVEIVCNEKLYIGTIENVGSCMEIHIEEEIIQEKEIYHVDIAQALIKDKKMDLVLQKTTELGVHAVLPLMTTRSIVKLDKKEEKKIERWRHIVKEASQQSKRTTIPEVTNVMTVEELVKLDYDVKILCSVNEVSKNIKKVLEKLKISDRILFVVGPEGGFDPKEEEMLIKHGFISVSLGNNVLRTETAPLYLLSVVSYNFMR